jgi:phenylpyruvate tautomerase PptA (4-oxalocrotonate tautomerase family)
MPILEVTLVLKPGESLPPGLAPALADAAAAVFGSEPGGTWVQLTALPADHYSENGGGPPAGVIPVFVRVLKSRLPEPDALRAEAQRLAAAVAAVAGRPAENVHIIYEPPGAGRVAFGGRLVEG